MAMGEFAYGLLEATVSSIGIESAPRSGCSRFIGVCYFGGLIRTMLPDHRVAGPVVTVAFGESADVAHPNDHNECVRSNGRGYLYQNSGR